MGRELTALILAGLFLVGLVGIGLGANTDGGPAQLDIEQPAQLDSNNESRMSTISVSGTGSASAEADQARVFVAVTTSSEQPSNATSQLATETQRLREALANSSAVSSVTTTDYQLFERRDENRTRSFIARQSFEIVVNDTAAVGSVVDTAVAGGATEINGVSFSLSEETRQELRDEALDEAVQNAQAEATTLAESAGVSLGEVQSLSTVGDGGGPVFQTEAARADTVIDQGPVTVQATVQVTYAAEDPA
jgi:hypothetical protein